MHRTRPVTMGGGQMLHQANNPTKDEPLAKSRPNSPLFGSKPHHATNPLICKKWTANYPFTNYWIALDQAEELPDMAKSRAIQAQGLNPWACAPRNAANQ